MEQENYEADVAELLSLVGLAASDAGKVHMSGPADPLLRTRYKVGRASTATYGALGVAAQQLWKFKTGTTQEVSVDTRDALLALRADTFLRIDGAAPARERDPMGGFYQLANGRWFMLHCSFEHLRDGAARALGVAPMRAAAAEAFKAWTGDPAKLEAMIFEAGGCGAYVRTPEEWTQTDQAKALAASPLISVRKIGDSAPEPLPVGTKPLSGLRALDLTRVIAGPSGTRLIAELGADVLRVTRSDLPNSGSTDIHTGFGKRTTFLDLRDAAQKDSLTELVRGGDIFVQSYRTGALQNYGFSAEDLAKVRPGVIYVTLNAWGHSGPWQDRRGYDTVVQSGTGMAHTQAVDGVPAFQPVAALDYICGALIALGTIAAVQKRATEGGSYKVEISLAGAMTWLCSMGLLDAADIQAAPTAFDPGAIQRSYRKIDSVFGALDYIRPPVRLSETDLDTTVPPTTQGAGEPVWHR